jgi:hypothetical protein
MLTCSLGLIYSIGKSKLPHSDIQLIILTSLQQPMYDVANVYNVKTTIDVEKKED